MPNRGPERGGALLTVLWLTAALSAIAFSVATTVRTETEKTSTHLEQTRAYYLATGALDRALLWMQWGPGPRRPDGSPMFYEPGMPLLPMVFPTGVATVEIIPESSRLNVNRATPAELMRLFGAMGLPGERAQILVEAILDWRTAGGLGGGGLDQHYLALGPTFRRPHAAFEQIEELLYVRGVTPDLFYGTWARNSNGVLVRLPGLKDCLTVYGAGDGYDVNTAALPVLVAIGVPPETAAAIVTRRLMRPFLSAAELGEVTGAAGGARLRVGGNSVYTLRSTATLRVAGTAGVSDIRRSAAMVVKFNNNLKEDLTPYWVLRWYDNAGTN
jgi:general secretion pathway protein K